MQNQLAETSTAGFIAAFWGIAGFFFLIGNAITHLAVMSLQAMQYALTPLQWMLLLLNIVFMAYSEGYKGFQKNYAPRLAARAKYLSNNGSLIERILAPLFCMSFFNATKKRLLISYLMLLMILTFIFLFKMLPQPWRGLLDAGVVVGLIWGAASTAWYCYVAFSDSNFGVDPELAHASR